MNDAPRWLDRDAAAKYLSVKKDKLRRLVRADKIPQPTYLFGPNDPRWDRQKLDEALAGKVSSSHGGDWDERITAFANRLAGRGQARRQGQA